jgi:hypothetical protein
MSRTFKLSESPRGAISRTRFCVMMPAFLLLCSSSWPPSKVMFSNDRKRAEGQSAAAIAGLAVLDDRVASAPHLGPRPPVPLRARARILEMSELLTQHAIYFDTGAA